MKKSLSIPRLVIALVAMTSPSIHSYAQQTLLGSTDIPSYIEEVAPIPDNIKDAVRRTYGADVFDYNTRQGDHFYRDLEARIQVIQDRYLDYYGKKQEGLTYSEEDAKKEVEKNYIVQRMGGVDAIQSMSEEEREAAAKEAAAEYIANPFAANGVQSAGMTALYQKIVSDPAYAARFEKMSEAEKEAELRKYMANDTPQTKTPAQMKAQQEERAKQNAQADKVRNSQEIILKMQEWNEQIQAALDEFGAGMTAIWTQPGNHEDIEADFRQKYEQIPLVILGEGREKDPEMEKSLRLETVARHRDRAESELQQTMPLLVELQSRYVAIAAGYMDWIKHNGDKVNGDMADYFNGTHTEIPLANFEMSLLGLASNLIDHSEKYTADAAGWGWRYLEIRHQYAVK